MTTDTTETVRTEHAQLRDHVEHIRLAARELRDLSDVERAEVLARILHFLHETLLPHALEEEHTVYAAVAEILGSTEATATMVFDHAAIRARVIELFATPQDDIDKLQELLYSLHALISVHFAKEEQLYLPLLERPAQPAFNS